jgi:Co/Zn/Cd efflux system component
MGAALATRQYYHGHLRLRALIEIKRLMKLLSSYSNAGKRVVHAAFCAVLTGQRARRTYISSMVGCCDDDCTAPEQGSDHTRWRRALWIALAVNAGMFLIEIGSGLASGSSALQADALDFFGDAANYALSLGVSGMALSWRARAAALKGATLLLFGMGILASTLWHLYRGAPPEPAVMGAVGCLALCANGGVAAMLRRFRHGDANRRSVWICARNDAIGNVAVLLAALGVFGTQSIWPDIVVAAILASLGLSGGWRILRHALKELRAAPAALVPRL